MVHATEVILTRIEALFREGLDGISGAFVTISAVHAEVHEGATYQASYKSPDGAEIADNGVIEMLLQVGAKYAHTVFSISCGGDSEVALYEGTTFSNAGTALSENNMKRPSGAIASLAATYTPTITLPGTLLLNDFIPGGTGPRAAGGTARRDSEWILKPNTNYLIRGINRSGNAQPMSIVAQWYEKTNA